MYMARASASRRSRHGRAAQGFYKDSMIYDDSEGSRGVRHSTAGCLAAKIMLLLMKMTRRGGGLEGRHALAIATA